MSSPGAHGAWAGALWIPCSGGPGRGAQEEERFFARVTRVVEAREPALESLTGDGERRIVRSRDPRRTDGPHTCLWPFRTTRAHPALGRVIARRVEETQARVARAWAGEGGGAVH